MISPFHSSKDSNCTANTCVQAQSPCPPIIVRPFLLYFGLHSQPSIDCGAVSTFVSSISLFSGTFKGILILKHCGQIQEPSINKLQSQLFASPPSLPFGPCHVQHSFQASPGVFFQTACVSLTFSPSHFFSMTFFSSY